MNPHLQTLTLAFSSAEQARKVATMFMGACRAGYDWHANAGKPQGSMFRDFDIGSIQLHGVAIAEIRIESPSTRPYVLEPYTITVGFYTLHPLQQEQHAQDSH